MKTGHFAARDADMSGGLFAVPKVSVLVPFFNVKRYLKQCLDSLAKQTLADIEVIMLDDGSTDGSTAIAEEFAAWDRRMRLTVKNNTGYGDTMNQGLILATGEYIGIVESDDFAEPEMFATLYELAKRHDAEIAKSCYTRYWSPKEAKYVPALRRELYGKVLEPAVHHELFRMSPSVWSAIYLRTFLRRNRIDFLPTPGASFQDTSFAFKAFALAKRVVFTDKSLINYRQTNPDSSVKSRDKMFCIRDEFDEIERFLAENGLESLWDVYYARRIHSYITTLFRLSPANRKIFLGETLPLFIESAKRIAGNNAALNKRMRQRLWLLAHCSSVFLLKCRMRDVLNAMKEMLHSRRNES